MSDLIPFHVQEEIMRRLPVKSLIQFRSVSKAWKSLIDSSEFIAAQSLHRHTQQQHLLVSYIDQEIERGYVSYIDDDIFPQQRSLLTLPVYDKGRFCIIGGSSHGLLCLLKSSNNVEPRMAVVWNPSIRKYIVVALPTKSYGVGFGVCPATSDPKIVAVKQSWDESNIETSYQCEVMVYTLSSGNWRNLSTNLPTKPIGYFWCAMVTDGFIYWRARTTTRTNNNYITLFDVTNESFQVIDLPDSFAYRDLGFSKLRESFAIIEYSENIGIVWMLEQGVQRSFTKLFTIKTPHDDDIPGFSKSGIPIVQVTDADSYDEPSKLVVFEPNSENNNVLEICPDGFFGFTVHPYAETLLLLGRPDCISY